MYITYNTNGLSHHRLDEAVELLAELGYEGVALTPDVGHLDLFDSTEAEWRAFGDLLRARGMACVLETGARFVLDPRRKHWPNLCTADDAAARRRIDYYQRACQRAASVGARVVSIWSGAPDDDLDRAEGMERLAPRLAAVLDTANSEGVRLAFEPEPGMLVDGLAAYRELRATLGRPDLGTTIDVGHLVVTETGAAHEHLAEFAGSLINVHLDDSRRGVHEHLPLGRGEIDFAAVFAELERIGYDQAVSVELSRDAHRAADAARESFEMITAARRKEGA